MATDDDGDNRNPYYGMPMMGSQMPYSYDQMQKMMGGQNWDLMWQHMRDHANGAAYDDDDGRGNPQLDRSMHDMMDWMMSGWTREQWNAFLTPTPQP